MSVAAGVEAASHGHAERSAPTIVHDGGLATVWFGDARDVLAMMQKESVDLILTDPPYGKEWRSNFRTRKFEQLSGDGADGEARAVIREIIAGCVRVVGQYRHLYVFGPAEVLDGQKVSEVVELIWDKGVIGTGDITAVWGPRHERISFCVSKHRHAGKVGQSVLPTRMRKGSVLTFMRPTGRKVRHPSEKPVPLLAEMIESSSRRGDVVFDPFAGAGGTAVAAILTGRRAIIVEKDDRWIPIILERVKMAEELARRMAEI